MSVFAYISGHGFGHWTRSQPVLSRLAGEVPVHVRTGDCPLPLARRAQWAASLTEVDVGPGCVQQGPLSIDVPATRAALAAYLEAWPDLLARELAATRAHEVRLVYGDVPPLAFAVAAELGVPAIAAANFSWSWIYEHYAAADPFFSRAAEQLRAAEGLATHVVALPGGGGLERLGPPTLEAVLRRPPTRERAAAQALLPRPRPDDRRPLVLVSFGGYGDRLDLSAAAAANPELAFVSFAPPAGTRPENLCVLPHDHGLPHQDLVLGADFVLAKPGYGIVSECLNRPTPLVYVEPTGEFREHPFLLAMIARWLPAAMLSREALHAGDWGAALATARAAVPAEPPPPNGLDAVLALCRRLLAVG